MGHLRDAVEDDVNLLFQWANEKSVRDNSFSTLEISYDEHVRWFQNVLSKDHVKQFIYMHEDEPVGQIRIAIDGQEAEISYSVCAEKRKMGFGREMLTSLLSRVKQDYPFIKKLTAKVKPDNIVSQKLFMDNGYDLKYYAYEIEIERLLKIGGGYKE